MNRQQLLAVIRDPVVSEKSTRQSSIANQVVFKVAGHADKVQIKKAVEYAFSVEVDSVRTLNVQGKEKRHGKSIGRRSDWKKAYITLKPGFSIDQGIE